MRPAADVSATESSSACLNEGISRGAGCQTVGPVEPSHLVVRHIHLIN